MVDLLKSDKDGLHSTGLSSGSAEFPILKLSGIALVLKVGRVVHVVLPSIPPGCSNGESLQSSGLSPSSHKISLSHPSSIPDMFQMGEVLQLKVFAHPVGNDRKALEPE